MRNPPFAGLLLGMLATGALASKDMSQLENFARLDENRDGALTPREYATLPEPPMSFAELDVDGDGRLSRDEYHRLETARTHGSG